MHARLSNRIGTRRPGFTLIEVLVVVAIIALLVSILIPALTKAREQASGALCRSNMHQLMLGMHTYVSSEKVMPGSFNVLFASYAQKYGGIPSGATNWRPSDDWLGLPFPPAQWDAAQNPTHLKELQEFVANYAPKKGSLYRYVRAEKVYLCPKDSKGRPDPEDPKGGGGNGRYSYTMFGMLGYKAPEKCGSFTYVADFTPSDAGALPVDTSKPILKGTRKVWSMSKMLALAEEHPFNNINQGWVGESWDAGSYLAFRHHTTPNGGMGIFAFLDGHVEARRYNFFYTDNSTFPPTTQKFLGVDLLNEYQFPYSYQNSGGPENYNAFIRHFAYPY